MMSTIPASASTPKNSGSFFSRLKRSIGDAVVGDDFVRQDGSVDGMVLGASAGAVVGGALGAARGLHAESSDIITERPIHHNIHQPKLEGFRYSVQADWDRNCWRSGDSRYCDRDLDGWWHRYTPRISNRVVGQFQKPTLEHSHSATTLSSAATGALVGAGVGAVLGLATTVVGRSLGSNPMERKTLPPEVREKLVDESGDTVIKSTVVGTAAGAAIGLGAGLLEQSRAGSIQRTWSEPLMQRESLGQIPRNHYERNWRWDWARPGDYHDHSPRGNTNVVRDVPVLDAQGRPQMQDVTGTLSSQRYGPITGMLGGAAVGAGLGFATGVATSIVNRLILQSGLE